MKRVITSLIIILIFTEFLVMAFLAGFSGYFHNPWIEALFDAVVVSIVAMMAISYLLKTSSELPTLKTWE